MTLIGLIALDDGADRANQHFVIRGGETELWNVLERAQDLLETSRFSHITLVRALIDFKCPDDRHVDSKPLDKERDSALATIKAFMGWKVLEPKDLGEWKRVSQHKFNAKMKENGLMEGVFSFIGGVDWDNADRYII